MSKKKEYVYNKSIRRSIFMYFTITTIIAVILIVVAMYYRFYIQFLDKMRDENLSIVNRISYSVENYIRSGMKLSDSIYYGLIKNTDLSKNSIRGGLSLLYNNNKWQVQNIAIISKDGKLLFSEPAARIRKRMNVTKQEWFLNALKKTENIHFSNPIIQNIFDSKDDNPSWVIRLSRAVEITEGGSTEQAVLMIDLTYQGLDELLQDAYKKEGYLYLINSKGDIIWHPKFDLVVAGRFLENNKEAAGYVDGSYKEVFNDEERTVAVKSIGYTGWKLVGVIYGVGVPVNTLKTRIFIVFVILFIIFIVMLINTYISYRITNPIRRLESSVKELEKNLETNIYFGGSYEIQRLSKTIRDMRDRIKSLMDEIVVEHEEKRRSEFNSLQAQINPHFLYNTLDIIVWQIENEKQAEAVKIVTALARFFRLSLGKGKNIVTLGDEIEHIKNYLTIQHMRFKNKFEYEFEIEESTTSLSSLKLMLQPLVENAIYHGMEFMDGDGLIKIKTEIANSMLFIYISDNGLGMTEEKLELVLKGVSKTGSKGSGIGVKNVNERIKLYFGEDYGLKIDSEPDFGTTVTVILPAIPYEESME